MENEIPTLSNKIPLRIERLEQLAYNFWWSWHREARDLFKVLDYPLWRSTGHNPVKMLREVSPERLEEVAADPLFLRRYDAVLIALDADLKNGHLWFPTQHPDLTSRPVAYFSAEFGLHQSLPTYAGGLGVLAGDHCKETSDIGLPFVGVGFLYEMGYFRQHITADGWQEAIYPRFQPEEVAIREALGDDGGCLFVPVEVGDRTVHVQIWHVQVGRTHLYLMDADHEQNAPWDRELTARLYGGDQEMRIQQEIVLGIGGVQVLRALGVEPLVFHLNEGHSSFLVLERTRELVEAGRSFDEARQIVRGTSVFTTHTPVPAGHDVFPFHLIEKYFHGYWPRLGLSREQFLELGSYGGERHGFNMTVGFDHQKAAVASGFWPLYRYDPRLTEQGKNPLQLDSKAPSIPLAEFAYSENRYKMLTKTKPDEAKRLIELAQKDAAERWAQYERLAGAKTRDEPTKKTPEPAPSPS